MKLITILVFVLFSLNLYSQDSTNFDFKKFQGVSVGGAGFLDLYRAGGFGEVGFSWYAKDGFDVRNNIKFGGGAFLGDALFFLLAERVNIGKIKPVTSDFGLRRFFLTEVMVSFYRIKGIKDNMFSMPLIIDLRIGSGLEFLMGKSSYYVETMLGFATLTKGSLKEEIKASHITGGVMLGGRKYF